MEDADEEDGGGGSEDEPEEEDNDPLEPVAGQVRLAPSLFRGRHPTIFFDYPKELGELRQGFSVTQPLNARKLVYKTNWVSNNTPPTIHHRQHTTTTTHHHYNSPPTPGA